MDGKDLQRRVGAQAAGKATRAGLETLRQHQQAAPGTAADCLKVNRHQAQERDASAALLEANLRSGRHP